jgi:hypothetical protein
LKIARSFNCGLFVEIEKSPGRGGRFLCGSFLSPLPGLDLFFVV